MLCLSVGALSATIAVVEFTLAWTHSIENVRWEEDWRIEGAALHLDAARLRGSGAGMEIPDGARLVDGVWHFRPTLPPQPDLRLANSLYPPLQVDLPDNPLLAAPYELCTDDGCRPLTARLPDPPGGPGLPAYSPILLTPCP